MVSSWTAARRVWQRALGLVWIVFLAFPIYYYFASPRSAAERTAVVVLLAAFVAVYVYFYGFAGAFTSRAGPAVLAMTAISTGLTLLGPTTLSYTLTYCVIAAAFGFPWRQGLAAVVAITAWTVLLAALERAPWTALLIITGFQLTMGVWMLGIGHIVRSNIQLNRAREEVARLAVAEERLRFARDLHDLLGHSLTQIVLKAELAGRLAANAPERSAVQVRDIEVVARQALREVREAVAGYRQPSLDQELAGVRSTLAAAGFQVHVEPLVRPLPTPVDATLGWALREGVTNVLRHSQAAHVAISLRCENGSVRLELTDDGVGAGADRPFQPGNGLLGLSERVAARQGEAEFGPRSEGGFRLLVSLPLKEPARGAAVPL